MNEVQEPARRGPAGQFSRFVGVGALNSLATFVLYQVLLLAIPYWLAFTVSFAAGLVFGLVAGARVVFNRRINPVSAMVFALYYVFSYLFSLLMLMVLVDQWGISARLAPLIVIAVMVPLNFIGARFALHRETGRRSE